MNPSTKGLELCNLCYCSESGSDDAAQEPLQKNDNIESKDTRPELVVAASDDENEIAVAPAASNDCLKRTPLSKRLALRYGRYHLMRRI